MQFTSQRRDMQSRSDQCMKDLVFQVETIELIWKTEMGLEGKGVTTAKMPE